MKLPSQAGGVHAALAAWALAAAALSGAQPLPPVDAPPQHGHVTVEPPDARSQRQITERIWSPGTQRMMTDMHEAGISGDVDIDFLAMMIPHHAGAIEMASLALQHGDDPATRRLAEDIIASQTVEIESMQRRLNALRQRGNATSAADPFPALSGTRGR